LVRVKTMIQTSVVGGYPKTLADQKIRKTLRGVDEGKVSSEELERVYVETTELAIRDQEEVGLDVVADGCLRWDDEITYLARGLEGFKIGGLTRFFDTNVLYRQPRAVGRIKWKTTILASDFRHAKRIAKKPLKQILTGPFTLMKLATNDFYSNEETFLLDLAEALNQEILALEKAGAAIIHINEHALAYAQEDFFLFQKAIGRLLSGVKADTTLYLSFGDAQGVVRRLLDLPVTSIGIDFTYSPGSLKLIESGLVRNKVLAGVVDARNTRLEDFDETRRVLDRLTSQVRPEDLTVAPSASLEFLPLDRCRTKLRNMVNIVQAYEGGRA
jgi:5-methyltetrahydropteroyltriglutamate--homocysteine methyltransferase